MVGTFSFPFFSPFSFALPWQIQSVHWGHHSPTTKSHQKHHPLSCQAYLFKSIKALRPFRQSPPLYLFFEKPPLVEFFSKPPKHLNFSSITLSFILKVTEFLAEIPQFQFLVMTEKNLFALNLFVIKYFRF